MVVIRVGKLIRVNIRHTMYYQVDNQQDQRKQCRLNFTESRISRPGHIKATESGWLSG